MANYKLSETKAFLRLVLGTFSVLGLLTAANVLMIMNSVGTDIFKPLKRNIASVAPVSKYAPEKIESPTVEINCRKNKKAVKITTKATSARIFFKNCKKIGRLLNESNQNQGDIFPLEANQWTSDFIFLNPGENRIKAPIGKTTQIIEITREIIKKSKANKAL